MTRKWQVLLTYMMLMAFGSWALMATALAAKPRSSIGVRSSLVKLSDLFSDLEAGQDCDIGPAPGPGKRIVIGQLQLAAIAAQFGVDWQAGLVPVQVTIERQARSISREELLPLIRSALIAEGAPEDNDISLGTYATLSIPAEITGQPALEALAYDRRNGHFAATLIFSVPEIDPMQLRVAGTVQEMIRVPVFVHPMNAGSVIVASDLDIKRLHRSLVGERTLLVAANALGLAVRHRMTAGDPVSLDELSRPIVVSRGMSLVLRLEGVGLVLMATGEAIEDGAIGDRIHVLNPISRAVLVARVTGPASVQVDPTSTPVMLTSQQSGLPPAYSMAALIQPSSQLGSVP